MAVHRNPSWGTADNSESLVLFGASIAQACVKQGLIDDYRLLVHPVVLGSGQPLWKDVTDRCTLKLIQARTFRSGIVGLGQALYVMLATSVYLVFILAATVLLCVQDAFVGNIWSETAGRETWEAEALLLQIQAEGTYNCFWPVSH